MTGGRGRSKRQEILAAATERFGRDGYEHTKWADIAHDVGVGPTALYHYFESKQHCLYEIMDEAIEDFRARFVAITTEERDPARALAAVMADSFELSEQEVHRNRVLVAEQGRLSHPSTARPEEEARQAARARTRDLEFAWASFLAVGDARGSDPAERSAPAHARRPRPLQQHLALVPPERHRRASRASGSTSPSWRWRWSACRRRRSRRGGRPHERCELERETRARRTGSDRRHGRRAGAARLGVPALRHRHVPAPGRVSPLHVDRRP